MFFFFFWDQKLGNFFPGVNLNKFANYWKNFQNFQCHEVEKMKLNK